MSDQGFLVLPKAGEGTVRSLVRKVRLLAIRSLSNVDLQGPLGASVRRLQNWLPGALRAMPEAVLGAVGAPDVLPHLLCVAAQVTDPAPRLEEAVPNLLASMPVGLPEAFLWDRPVRRLAAPHLGRAWILETPARGMVLDPLGAELRHGDDRLERLPLAGGDACYHPLDEWLHLATLDTNPLSHLEEHPDKEGNAVDLGGQGVQAWVEALREALGLIEAALPDWAAERRTCLQRLVPVGFESERHLSASYREAPGIAWLTLHPDPLTLAEAIVHETQHTKLNLVSWLDPVLENGQTTWTESPVRPDMRPLMGVLLAVHAFVPVAVLHRNLAEAGHPLSASPKFLQRRSEVLETNGRGLAVLEREGQWTPIGRRVFGDLSRIHGDLVD